MPIRKIKKTVYRCTCIHADCGHVWDADEKPERCAKCKRFSWNGEDRRRGKFKRERVSA